MKSRKNAFQKKSRMVFERIIQKPYGFCCDGASPEEMPAASVFFLSPARFQFSYLIRAGINHSVENRQIFNGVLGTVSPLFLHVVKIRVSEVDDVIGPVNEFRRKFKRHTP